MTPAATNLPPLDKTQGLHLGYVDVYFTFCIDASALFEDESREANWRDLLQRRVGGTGAIGRDALAALAGRGATKEDDATEIARRMETARQNDGKAIWTDHFLQTETALRLKTGSTISMSGREIPQYGRVSDDVSHPFHYARFKSHRLKVWREGTFSYTVQYQLLHEEQEPNPRAKKAPPLSVETAVELLKALEGASWEVFAGQLSAWFTQKKSKEVCERLLGTSELSLGYGVEELRRRGRVHKILFIDRFLQRGSGDRRFPGWGAVDNQEAKQNVALGGLLNTADWYRHYREEYIRGLAQKDIGYRDDELYITDRKATLVSNPAFWDDSNTLAQYRLDLVLAVEYWVVRLVQAHALLAYLQSHSDIVGLAEKEPRDGLVIATQAMRAFARFQESLDASRIVDHGFTSKFMDRLRQEMDIGELSRFIRERLADAATSIGLRSAVKAEEVTAQNSLALTRRQTLIASGTLIATALFSIASFILQLVKR
jgi:hypothetical protein